MNYYAWIGRAYISYGAVNKKTGNLSCHGHALKFPSEESRRDGDNNFFRNDSLRFYQVSKKGLRKFFLGMTINKFDEMIECLEFEGEV